MPAAGTYEQFLAFHDLSLIHAAKVRARGYRTTRHLVAIAYLIAGKMTLLPASRFVDSRSAKGLA